MQRLDCCEHGVPFTSGVCNACFPRPTDNPSSSVPVSKGTEIAKELRWANPPCGMCAEAGEQEEFEQEWAEANKANAALIDSALASQEARHQKALESERETAEGLRKGYRLLEEAYAAEQARHRQEMEEAHKVNAEAIANQRALSSLEHKTRLELRAAEQREREAGEALRGMLLSADADWELLPAGGHDWPEACVRARAALASIRCAPSPVSAPPTRIRRTEADNARLVRGADEGEIALIVFAPGKPGEGGYASVDFGYENGRFWASFGRFDPAHGFYPGEFVQIATLEDLYRAWDAALKEIARRKAASPVEPGSDPQEPNNQ